VTIQGSGILTPKQIQRYAVFVLNAGAGTESVQLVDLGSAYEDGRKIAADSIMSKTGNSAMSIADATGVVSFEAAPTLTQTTAAGSDTATLTNAPVAGNPTVWANVIYNGTTYCIPLFPIA
jgi:hypothetical protein